MTGRAEQVPSVAFDVQEHRDVAVWLAPRSGDEFDPFTKKSMAGAYSRTTRAASARCDQPFT
jgi:hypothetical protein